MSSSRRTVDTEMLTMRQVYAYNSNNSVVPAQRVLTADGRGGTFWQIPSSIGALPSFNRIVADGLPIVADASYNTLYLSTAEGLGSVRNSTTKEVRLFSKCFSRFDVSGGNILVGYSNSQVTPTVKFAGLGGVLISGDPLTNTLFFQTANPIISTGFYAYHKINVVSNASTVSAEAVVNTNSNTLTATSPSTVLTTIGVGDILLTTNVTSNAYFIGISTFTSRGYLDISGVTYGTFSSVMSTVSTLFYDNKEVGQATSSIMDSMSNMSIGIRQQFNYDEQNVMLNYLQKVDFGLASTLMNANTATLTNQVQTLNRGLYSTISFFSTMNINLFGCNLGGVIDAEQNFTYSSVSFRMDSFSTLAQRGNAGAVVNYKPSFLFATNTAISRVFFISTMIYAGTTLMPSSIYVRPFMAPSSNSSNLYNDSLEFWVPHTDLERSYTSTYTFYHHVHGFETSGTGIQSCNVLNQTFVNNSLSVRLAGINYNNTI
jgi:hypothetical protein